MTRQEHGGAGSGGSAALQALTLLVAVATGLPVRGQETTVLEVKISDYRAERVPFVCPDGREIELFAIRRILFDADVTRVISGEFEGDNVAFVSIWPLNFQCVELLPLPDGAYGQRLRELGVMYEGRPAECGDFRPNCETDPRSGNSTCWDGWFLEIESPVTVAAEAPPEPNLQLIDRFLAVRNFTLVESLAGLPADVQSRLSRWEDGSFSIAEKGEYWNSTDVMSACNPEKGSQHWLSGVTDDVAVIFYLSGGIAVFSNVQIVDRRTGEALTCFIDGTAMREWNGTNHSDSMFAGLPIGLSTCRVPYMQPSQ